MQEKDLETDFFKLMNNVDFEKTMKNVKNYRDIKLVTTDARRKYLMSELNYHKTKFFLDNVLAMEIERSSKKLKDTRE